MTLGRLEAALGFTFADRGLVEAALTHRSFGSGHYERLEFLGDRVLGLAVGTMLVEKFAGADEGELSRRFTAAVRESTLVKVAEKWELAGFLRVGGGEQVKDGILADAVEALLGAVFMEGGWSAAEAVVRREWAELIDIADEKDAKTRLQELLQGQGLGLPEYVILAENGAFHERIFTVEVRTPLGSAVGEGRSKQVAGSIAASKFMEILEK